MSLDDISSKIQRVSSLKDITILTFASYNGNVCGDPSHDSQYLQCRPAVFATNPDYEQQELHFALRDNSRMRNEIIIKCQDIITLVTLLVTL